MNEFEKIIAIEKQRHYAVEDKDQFVFDTVTKIHARKSRLFRRVLWLVLSLILGVAIAAQLYFLQHASYSGAVETLIAFVQNHPYYLGLANLAIILSIFALKKAHVL